MANGIDRRGFIQLAAAGAVLTGNFGAAAAPSETTTAINRQPAPEFSGDLNTADILIETLIAWGATHVFGVVGDGVNSLIEALRRRQDRSSDALAAAYGIAVSGTMLITTLLLAEVARRQWGWGMPTTVGVIRHFSGRRSRILLGELVQDHRRRVVPVGGRCRRVHVDVDLAARPAAPDRAHERGQSAAGQVYRRA
jgi:hypothetical protein